MTSSYECGARYSRLKFAPKWANVGYGISPISFPNLSHQYQPWVNLSRKDKALMRNRVSVFYYPEFYADYSTVMKAMLLFDELHFMDRPSMMFGQGPGQYGTIGAASPLRQIEVQIREEGMPFYVHPAPMGPVYGEWYERIKSDVNDPEFLRRFQNGLKVSPTFRNHMIVPGNYGEWGNETEVTRRLIGVDLSADLKTHENAMALFEDFSVQPFRLGTPIGCAKQLVCDAVTCSAKMNFALDVAAKEGFFPMADANPYGDLLGAKYARAINALAPSKNKPQITDLSFAIFDQLISEQRLRQLSLKDVLDYRRKSEKAREAFLEHISVIQAKQAAIEPDGDYAGAISKVIDTEIRPAVQEFRNKLQTIDESILGAIIKGAIGAVGGSSVLTLFGDASLERIIVLAGAAGAYVAKAAVDAILAQRAARRECTISYILSLDE